MHGVRISVREFEALLNANPVMASRLGASIRDGEEGDVDYEHLVDLQVLNPPLPLLIHTERPPALPFSIPFIKSKVRGARNSLLSARVHGEW